MTEVIDLTTKEKADSYFESLATEKRFTKEEINSFSNEELTDLCVAITLREIKEQKDHEENYVNNYNPHSDEKKHSENLRQHFASAKFNHKAKKREKVKLKKLHNHTIENFSKHITNTDFEKFKKSFHFGLSINLRGVDLKVSDFTEKELLRFRDFSLNRNNFEFGV